MIGPLVAILVAAQPAPRPLDALDPLLDQTWRGMAVDDAAVTDVLTFERVAGGGGVRSVHSVNGGVYSGETLLTADPEGDGLVLMYVTSAGFHATGTAEVRGPGSIIYRQTIVGVPGLSEVESVSTLEGGVYRVRIRHLRDGEWVDAGGFDYRSEP